MTPDELSELLQLEEYLVVDIPPAEFTELEITIGTRVYTYRPEKQPINGKDGHTNARTQLWPPRAGDCWRKDLLQECSGRGVSVNWHESG